MDKLENEKEKLIELRFIDSFRFMASSLDSLARNLVGGGCKMFGFENCLEQLYKLLTRKGVCPYEHMTSWDLFENTELPLIESFYRSLNMSGVSKSDYQHAQRVWEEFGIRNIRDHHDLYLRIDVLLLANVLKLLEICA